MCGPETLPFVHSRASRGVTEQKISPREPPRSGGGGGSGMPRTERGHRLLKLLLAVAGVVVGQAVGFEGVPAVRVGGREGSGREDGAGVQRNAKHSPSRLSRLTRRGQASPSRS